MRKDPGGRVSLALKFSVYYFGGAGAFVPFWLFRLSPAVGPTPYAPRLVVGFARSAIAPTEHAYTPDRDEAGDSDQSSHLNNHGLPFAPGREGGSSVTQASQAARGADLGVILRPVKKSTMPSRSIRQTIASTARGRQ